MPHRSAATAFSICAALLVTAVSAGDELRDALKLKPDLRRGQALYASCAACHGPEGSGSAREGVPGIAGQHYRVILKQLADFRATERLDLRMEASTSRHHLRGARDLADVAGYVAALAPQATTDVGPGNYADAGRRAYEGACAHCHGTRGEGNARLKYPRLAGQHYTYLLKQIDTMVGGSRFNVSWDHAQLLTALTDEEMMGVADHLSRLGSEAAGQD